MSVKRVFVEKKPEYAIKAGELREEIESYLDITGVTGVRVLVRYDIENISEDVYKEALGTIFSEPPVDDVFEETFPHSADDVVFSVEYLPGQFDQRAGDPLRNDLRDLRKAFRRGDRSDQVLLYQPGGLQRGIRGDPGDTCDCI